MKTFAKEFLFRGLMAASGGPIILAIIYACLGAAGTVSSLSPREVCLGIVTITLLALTAGGMTAIYQVERLPLATAIMLHGAALYAAYILVYLLNGWLERQLVPILIFSAIFITGYALVWLFIYGFTRRKTMQLNEKLHSEM